MIFRVVLSILVGGSVAACGGSATVVELTDSAEPAPAFTRTHVLRGPEGARVSIAEFGDDEVLFEISGTRANMNGYALRGKVEDAGGGRLRYTTKWDGSDWYPIHRDTRNGESVWRLYGTGDRNGMALEYDETESQKLDTDALYQKHASQTQDGTLAPLQNFDREAAEARTMKELGDRAEQVQEVCGVTPKVSVDWASISDEILKKYSIASYCENVLSVMRNLCRWQPGQAFFRKNAKAVTCTWSSELGLSTKEGKVEWNMADDSNLEEKARDLFSAMKAEHGLTLGQTLDYAKTDVCESPNGKHVLAVHPHQQEKKLGISYGTKSQLFHSPQPYGLGRGWFFEPRQFRKQNNENFRGRDLRYYSHVDVEREAGKCELSCGERDTSWKLLPGDKAREVLMAAKSEPSPFDREPYALARDPRGTYYYVDRGSQDSTQSDFRIYKGKRGQMKRLEMKDVASDSEGEVFTTAGGKLRFLVGKSDAQWFAGKKPMKLRRIPVSENYGLIMNELGIYLGDRFELPCDDY